jgi:Nif-specific regulatory protein
LTRGAVTIGREPSNDITVLDDAVSRRHCAIEGDGRRFVITHLGKRSSTFVNGAPVTEQVLESGDEIRVGDCVFTFVPHADSNGANGVRNVEHSRMPEPATRAGDATRGLDALLRVTAAVNSIGEPELLERTVLEAVLDAAPADRAAIVLLGDSSDQAGSTARLERHGQRESNFEISRWVLRQVVEQGVAVLSNDVPGEPAWQDTAGLIERRVHSLLTAPLKVYGRVRGVLYLESSNPLAIFDDKLQQFIAAVASVAAQALENARRLDVLANGNRRLEEEIDIEHEMIGESPRMREIYLFIAKVAPTDSTVLIHGESGTGKELVARAIHKNSRRAGKPFVAINCAAITETLLESELFGHEKGAFTGAVSQKKGKLEVAEGGVVFLDEIGELAPVLQAKLLRVLQEREFERVGGTRPIKLNVRLIAATNRDLQELARSGGFRQDLYYRLNVVSIRMPALRDRREDVEPLAAHFARKYAEKMNRTVTGISAAARASLVNYAWPGNVRELENAMERAVVLGSGAEILAGDLPEAILERHAACRSTVTRYHEGVQEAKKRIILTAVQQAGGQYTEAARLLGVHPNYLHRLMRNLNLKAPPAGD